MTSPNLNARLTSNVGAGLAVFRIVVGLLFAIHGSSKLFGWPVGESLPMGQWPGWWAGLIEFVAGLLVAIGLATRPAAFIASGQMAVAYFWQHWPFPEGASFWPIENNGELAVIYCFAFLLLVFAGPGRFAVDTRRRAPVAGSATRGVVTGTAAPVARRPGLLDRFRRR